MSRLMKALLATLAISVLTGIARAQCFGFGIVKVICIDLGCPAGQVCTKFGAPFPIIGWQEWCECVPGGGGGGGGTPKKIASSMNASFGGGNLTLSGSVTNSDFAADPIIGAPISFSGPIPLSGAQIMVTGTEVAIFRPAAATTVAIGTYMTANVTNVTLVEGASSKHMVATLSGVAAGGSFSDFVNDTLALPGLQGVLLEFDIPAGTYTNVTSGSLTLTSQPGLGVQVALPAAKETFNFTDVPSNGPAGDPVNGHVTFTSTGGYTLGTIRLNGTLQKIASADFASEKRIQLTSPGGKIKVLQPFTTTSYTTLTLSSSTQLATGLDPAGLWDMRFFESFDDGGTTAVDGVYTTLSVGLTDDLPGIPATAEDLGAVCTPGLHITRNLAPGQVLWFKIDVPEATDATKYFDIDTETTTGITDTELGLYTAGGELVATDDDDGSGFLSQLTFGAPGSPRPPVGSGLPYNGRDGNLSPGTYYLVAAQFNATFPDGFAVTTTGTGSGTAAINIQTNMVCNRLIAGAVNLECWTASPSLVTVTFEIRNTGSTTPLETHSAALSGSGSFSFNTSLAPGTYDIAAKGPMWLRQVVPNVVITPSGTTGLSFSLKTGDIVPDNEVNLSDYAALAAAFGTTPSDSGWDPRADLDGDGEVTLADYACLSSRFGEAGDD